MTKIKPEKQIEVQKKPMVKNKISQTERKV